MQYPRSLCDCVCEKSVCVIHLQLPSSAILEDPWTWCTDVVCCEFPHELVSGLLVQLYCTTPQCSVPQPVVLKNFEQQPNKDKTYIKIGTP